MWPTAPPYLGHGGQGLVGGGAWPTAPAVSRSRWAGFGWWRECGPRPPPYLGHGGQGLVGGGAWPTAPAVSRSRWAGFGWWRSAAHGPRRI